MPCATANQRPPESSTGWGLFIPPQPAGAGAPTMPSGAELRGAEKVPFSPVGPTLPGRPGAPLSPFSPASPAEEVTSFRTHPDAV